MFEKGNKTGNRFKKGEPTKNPKGRPKKILSSIKDQGYTESQAMEAMKVLMALSVNELKTISKEKSGQYTALEQICAGALVANFNRKSQYNLLQLVERVFGKPKETVDNHLTGKVKVTLNLKNEK